MGGGEQSLPPLGGADTHLLQSVRNRFCLSRSQPTYDLCAPIARLAAVPTTRDMMWAVGRTDMVRQKANMQSKERLIFSRRRSKPERFKFKRARKELITLNQPILGSSPRGLTSNSSSISERLFYGGAADFGVWPLI